MAKEVAVKQENQIASYSYGDLSGSGFEGTKGSDLSIPFINLLQSNSPEVEEQLIPDAKSGDMLNTVTGELIKGGEGFVFLPVHKQEAWVEWIPRNKGGGFAGLHDPNGELVKELISNNGNSRIPPKDKEGKRISFKHGQNDVIEAYYVYGLILDKEGAGVESFAVVAFSSTKIKPYRDWMTSMYLLKGKPPIFANRAKILTVKQKNDSGTYSNFQIMPLKETWAKSLIDPVSEKSLLDEAVAFRDMVINGVAKADFSNQREASTSGDGSHSGTEAPF